MLLSKSKVNRPGYEISNYFCSKNRQSNLVLVLILVLKVPNELMKGT